MLKYIKGNLERIEDVQIYPIISLLIFFIFFTALLWWVFTVKNAHINEVSSIPLNDNNIIDNPQDS